MRFFDMLLICFTLIALFFASFLIFEYYLNSNADFSKYVSDESISSNTSVQFYSNMRYKSNVITYSIENLCNIKKTKSAEGAFKIIEDKTNLKFIEVNDDPQISVVCSEIAPDSSDKDHFVAGEGGPVEVIQTSKYNVILSGKISLFRNERCDTPQIAVHEILHALGYDHNNNQKSILYPYTACDQIFDDYLIEDINRVYREESKPDLSIFSVDASKIGRYIDFDMTISNIGLEDSPNFKLIVRADQKEIKQFDIQNLSIGTKRTLNVKNLKGPLTGLKLLEFEIDSGIDELDKNNNLVVIGLK